MCSIFTPFCWKSFSPMRCETLPAPAVATLRRESFRFVAVMYSMSVFGASLRGTATYENVANIPIGTRPSGETLRTEVDDMKRSEERRVGKVTGVQTCALPIWKSFSPMRCETLPAPAVATLRRESFRFVAVMYSMSVFGASLRGTATYENVANIPIGTRPSGETLRTEVDDMK